MSSEKRDSNIPDDPRENRKRLQGIHSTYCRRLDSKQRALEKTQAKLDRAQSAFDADDGSDPGRAMRLASVVGTFEYHVSGLKRDVREQMGRVEWAQRQIEAVTFAIKKVESAAPLAQQPFAAALEGVSAEDGE